MSNKNREAAKLRKIFAFGVKLVAIGVCNFYFILQFASTIAFLIANSLTLVEASVLD
jgi:hypothetical protein